jgi:hypothetical protein
VIVRCARVAFLLSRNLAARRTAAMRASWRRRFKMVGALLCCLTAACSARQSPPQYTVAFGSSAPFNSDIFIADGDGMEHSAFRG